MKQSNSLIQWVKSILLFILWLVPNMVDAADENQLRRHIIVAADNAGTKTWVFSQEVAKAVYDALFRSYPSVQIKDSLLRYSDYFSLVKFDAKNTDLTLDGYYVRPILPDLDIMQENSDVVKSMPKFLETWSTARNNNHASSVPCYSILSVAKPYILQGVSDLALKAGKNGVKVNRTFLIMVTDHHYNANDYYAEITSWVKSGEYYNIRNRISEDSLSAFCFRVEQDYYIHHISTDTIGTRKFLEVYEYQPLQQHFTLPSTLSFPTKVKAHRIWGDKYKIAFAIGPQGNEHFNIDRVDISMVKSNNEIGYNTILSDVIAENRLDIEFDRRDKAYFNNIILKAWLSINDGFYGFTQMSPGSQSPDFLGRKGLTVKVEIEYEEDAHIWGIISMPDWLWWFFHDDQQKGALATSFLLIMMLLIGIILFFWKAQHYYPHPSQMKLRQIR